MARSDKAKLTALTLLLLLGSGKASHAQTTRPEPEPAVKERTISNDDTTRVTFSPAEKAIYAEAIGFTYATPENFKLVWAPLLVIKPTMTINDKYTVGFTTTQMFQNYTSDKLTPTIHDMYAHGDVKLGPVDAFVNVGNFSALNYASEMSHNMPMSYFFQNAIYMQSGHYMPMAIMGGIRGKHFSLSAGHAKHEHRLQFNGPGEFVVAGEAIFKRCKFGTFWMLGPDKKIGDVQFAYNYGLSALLIEFIGIGDEHVGGHATYSCKVADNQAIVFVNAYGQKDGIAGWHIGGRHNASGIYANMGFTYHDPLLRGTEKYEEPTPTLELGICYPLKIKTEKTR